MKKIFIYCLPLWVATFCACEDFLDKKPVSDLTSGTFWKSEGDANAGIIAMYFSFSQAMSAGCFDWGEIRGGNWDPYDRFGFAQAELINHAIPSTNSACVWSSLYQAVNRANLALKYIPNITMPATTKNTYLGEAYAMRALCYFYAVRVWGDVPVFTDPMESFSTAEAFRAATPREEILDLIQADLRKAEQLIPAPGTTINKKRFTRPAVYALMMDVHAWRHQYDMVISVMEEKVKGLNATYWGLDQQITSALTQADFVNKWRALWDEETVSKEQILTIYYDDLENGSHRAIDYYASGSQRVIASDDLKASYEPGDKRHLGSFDVNHTRYPFMKFWPVGTILSGTGVIKSDVNLTLYRYADLVLLYAEALNQEFKTQEAIVELNKIRLRSGVAEAQLTDFIDQEELALAILHERRMEFLGEGKYWFDLIRTGYAATLGGCPDTRKWVFPIHRDHLLQNTMLIQNPAWN